MKAEWFLRAMIELAKDELAKANATCGSDWPAQQEWHELSASSQSTFMHRARTRLGISHEAYLNWIRNYDGPEDIDAIYAHWSSPKTTGEQK